MTLKFSANITTMFNELEVLNERFNEAKCCGFEYVEILNPYCESLEVLKREKETAEISVSLINVPPVSHTGSPEDFGYAAVIGKEIDFQQCLNDALEYAFHLNCKKIHILCGFKDVNVTEEEQCAKYVENLQLASDILIEHGITGLIEPLCSEVKNNYFLDSFDKAVTVLKKVDRENIKLLLDFYHLHKISGNVEDGMRKFYPYAGYIQISQDPDRREPFFPDGKIDYGKILQFLIDQKYEDVIGLEYSPSVSTEDSLEWMNNYI